MAPDPRFPGLSVGNDLSYDAKPVARKGTFWRWFLAGTLLNVCISSIVIGMTVYCVKMELQSVKNQLQIHEDRLTWLEETCTKQGSVKVKVPTAKNAQLRTRREQDAAITPNVQNAPFFTRPDVADACDCRDGRDGKEGKDGRDGVRGTPGEAGAKGEKGDSGIDWMYGTSKMSGPRRMKRDVGDPVSAANTDKEVSQVHDVYPSIGSSGGATYIRWGRTTCPNRTDTEEVYAGFATGAYSSHKGGSVDFFCLPNNPDWADSYNDALNSNSFLYGIEYQIPFDPFSHDNAEFLNNHDVPCAVCRLMTRNTQMLFPAKRGCPKSWTEEYRGFLMSGHHTHEQRSKAVCVDQTPEAIPGSKSYVGGAMLHILEGRCGSLLCPPYVEGREITCTVCSI